MSNNDLTTTICDQKISILTENADGIHYLIKANNIKDLEEDWMGDCNVAPANDAPIYYASQNGELVPEKYCKNFKTLLDFLMARELGVHESALEYKPPHDALDQPAEPFIFDHELTVEEFECVNGYLWATNDMMKRLLESVVQQERREGYIPGATMENPNFYADYFPADGSISVTSTYHTQEMENGRPVEVQLSVDIPLDKEQGTQLIAVLEDYCVKNYGKSCLELVNEDREYHDIKPLTKKLPDFYIVMKDAVDRAHAGGDVAHSVSQPERL